MKCHIIPRTTLREFANDDKITVIDQEFNKFTEVVGKVGYIDDFYTNEMEDRLNKEFEQPYGMFKKKLKERIEERKPYLTFEFDEYKKFVEYTLIQWRRTEYSKKNMPEKLFDLGERMAEYFGLPDLTEQQIDEVKNKFEKLIEEGGFEDGISISEEDYRYENNGTMFKRFMHYDHKFIVNNTEMNFPLHDKVMTLNAIIDNNTGYRIDYRAIIPITNRISLVEELNEVNQATVFKFKAPNKFRVAVHEINTVEEVKDYIDSYILGTPKYVYVDETNIDYVEKVYKKKQLRAMQMNSENM